MEPKELFKLSFIPNFFKEIKIFMALTKRNDNYHLIEYGELTLVNQFINGIIRNDKEQRFLIMNESELEDKNKKYVGRVDLIIEDQKLDSVYYIEAKRFYSDANTPEKDDWNKPEKISSFYNGILNQAEKYSKGDIHNYKGMKHFNIALVFESVILQNEESIRLWEDFEDPSQPNEFYHFETFKSPSNKILGLACYGKIIEGI